MSFSRPIQWYHSHADPIWPDGTFNTQNGALRPIPHPPPPPKHIAGWLLYSLYIIASWRD
jgi:hypothetical protein